MPFPMNVQLVGGTGDSTKPLFMSRLRSLFGLQVPRSGPSSSIGVAEPVEEPSSVCLAKMVRNYLEQDDDNSSTGKHGPKSCKCLDGGYGFDDEFDWFSDFADSRSGGSLHYLIETLEILNSCATESEKKLFAETAEIVQKNKIQKGKDDLIKIVAEKLTSHGYDASICKSKWEKGPKYPAGQYEYIDVIVGGERILIDVDFRSEFEIARSTGAYNAILQTLPFIFVGNSDRLGQIISIASKAAKKSLKKKGIHVAPWRKAGYMRSKWLSPTFTRGKDDAIPEDKPEVLNLVHVKNAAPSEAVELWQPPPLKPRYIQGGAKMVTGLASLLNDEA